MMLWVLKSEFRLKTASSEMIRIYNIQEARIEEENVKNDGKEK